MEEIEALAQFAAGDDEAARRAFDVLVAFARPYLHVCLRATTGLGQDGREDIVQDALSRAWAARASYRNEGVAAWRGFLKTTARNACIDQRRKARPEVLQDGTVLAEMAASEYADTLETLMDALEAQTVRRQADLLWLGLDPALPPEAHTRRLLAAQMVFLDGLPWHTICRLLGPARPGEPPLTRAALDTWLADPGVLRHLTYHTIYYSNDRLAARLLGLGNDGSDHDLQDSLDTAGRTAAAAEPSAPGPGCWTWGEATVIFWRYRYALLCDQILQRDDCPFASLALAALIDRTRTCFPFSEEMVSLLAALGARGRQTLSDRALWQRLAFQYRYGDDLPHQDIQDRTQPAYRHVAPLGQPEITLGMLNVWLSNGRLLERLARACGSQEGPKKQKGGRRGGTVDE